MGTDINLTFAGFGTFKNCSLFFSCMSEKMQNSFLQIMSKTKDLHYLWSHGLMTIYHHFTSILFLVLTFSDVQYKINGEHD